jgi:peroxiredoxin-like protein
MSSLSFDVELSWTANEEGGIGEIRTDNQVLDVSAPEAMGGRGVGTNPEELLVSAVSSCYTATLFAVLQKARLPVDSLKVAAKGTVCDFPRRPRFEGLIVSPTIEGGIPQRRAEYETAALRAHSRCLIGRALAPGVTYALGPILVKRSTLRREQTLAWRSGE